MPLDPQVKGLLDELAASGAPPRHTMTPTDARAYAEQLYLHFAADPEEVASTKDYEVPGPGGPVQMRLYRPLVEPPADEGPLPVLVYFHGGGWMLGSIETHAAICCALANRGGCVVASVGYRLAPEHKFPAPLEDCFAATEWLVEHAAELDLDLSRLAVGGDSAGGNLATALALTIRDRGGPRLAFQLLLYPVTDYYQPGTLSYQENADGYYLTRDTMIYFWQAYLGDENDVNNPYAAPLRAAHLESLPPALIITAEYDPLRDEGEAYATRLEAAGVPVTLTRYEGMIHGFMGMTRQVEVGRQALDQAGTALRSAWAD